MKTKNLLCSFLLLLLLTSCFDTSNRPLLPSITGKAGELVLVIDDKLWDGEVGDKVDSVFSKVVVGLPQEEPMLDIVQINEEAFSSIFQTNRNILFIKIGKEYKTPGEKFKKDLWADHQLVGRIHAPNKTEMLKLLEQKGDSYCNLFVQAEQDRIIRNCQKFSSDELRRRLRKKMNVDISVLPGFNIATDTTDFMWISYEPQQVSQGIFIYSFPYLDTTDVNKQEILNQRDAFLRRYVPGPTEGSHMVTSYKRPITYKKMMMDGRFTVEIRGLWRVHKNFMGGPFVGYYTVDEKRGRIIAYEGWVYAAGKRKRNYLRQVESILQTFKVME